ncbi:hypothetical protein ACLQ9J_04270 [Bordetella hinzii]|uniref:hypothetical protein n=1 Tax=Bordetella hinzii TaxID=103855 RepID=UPI0039FDCB65
MSKYEITVSVTPVCPSCGKDLAVGFTLSNPTNHPLERDDPLARADRRVFVHSCPDCFVFKPDADGMQEQRDELLEALEGVLRVADRATVEFDAARAAIRKAKGEQQ